MRRHIIGVIVTVMTLAMVPGAAFAHVVVTPKQAVIGERTLFTVSVPNEKKTAVTSIRLTVPSGLEDVQPNVLGGWNVTTDVDADGNTTAIIWDGNIPVGQRADLVFKAQAPATATELDWKADQTYADGTIVHWDQKPTATTKDDDSATTGPYSVTQVVDDLDGTATSGSSSFPLFSVILSVFAVIVSVFSLLMRRRKR